MLRKMFSRPIVLAQFMSLWFCFVSSQGVIGGECEPEVFLLRGEALHIWEMDVDPNQGYIMYLEPESGSENPNTISVSIVESTSAETLIQEVFTFSGEAEAMFETGDAESITIYANSPTGEGTEDLGTYSITICRVKG